MKDVSRLDTEMNFPYTISLINGKTFSVNACNVVPEFGGLVLLVNSAGYVVFTTAADQIDYVIREED